MNNLTPMMQQYMDIKNQYLDAILFFRMGDFYEMFFEDAEIAARVLDLAITSRNKGGGEKAPMAGIPYHSADSYISKLIDQGFKVAICEQLEDPSESSGIVKRDVIRVITPGTIIENELLEEKNNNYLAAIVQDKEFFGFSYIDISTGEFFVTELKNDNDGKLWDELERIQPKEIIVDTDIKKQKKFQYITERANILINDSKITRVKKAREIITEHFEINSLAGFGLEENGLAIIAAAEILNFIIDTQKRTLNHVNNIKFYSLNEYMILDSATRRNLELTSTIMNKNKNGSLLDVLDQTLTSMGGRLIKKWINQPLVNKINIDKRLNSIEELIENYMLLQAIRNNIDGIYDLERILTKITYESANARDLAALRHSLKRLPDLKKNTNLLNSDYIKEIDKEFDTLKDITHLIENSIVDEPPVSLREGNLIKDKYNEKLDELRDAMKSGREWISNLQKTERKRTDISSLKVGFNKVFGYYIEVTKANLDKVPENYTRKQTLSNSERYITPELKEKEAMVLGAEEKVNDLEYNLFVKIRKEIAGNLDRIRKTAYVVAIIDVLTALALVAIENNYRKPLITNNNLIYIEKGRHPVVEIMVNDSFVPNDTRLDSKDQSFIIITGPNMSGKSTYMRQVALIVLMAQIGSFVPVDKAEIGLVDRIFTRVGASDDLTTGQSTFMVEMNEVANIINNATEKSLVILDEVGRGTSTYDGLSIAWAVSEYINQKINARSLFATHYHELTQLEKIHESIKNHNVLVKEDEEGVHFLHKIVPGMASDSYGIEVAKLAGLPVDLIENANNILKKLEEKNKNKILKNLCTEKENIQNRDNSSQMSSKVSEEKKENTYLNDNLQLRLFEKDVNKEKNKKIIDRLIKANLLDLTPMEAMNFLYKLQQSARKGD